MPIKSTTIYIAWAILVTAVSQGMAVESCESVGRAQEATYVPWSKLVIDDAKAISNSKQEVPFAVAIDKLAQEYYRQASVGDGAALNKLIGIGLFTAFAKHAPPLDVTFKLVCESARKSPLTILPALTCAVIAIDGPRRDNPQNRMLARQMIDLAKANLERDTNGPAARKLFDDVAPVVINCNAG
jgi:hypothetical protein